MRREADTNCYTECMKSQKCAPLKHHYDECAERVMKQQEETGKAEEDCVEECKSRMQPERCETAWDGQRGPRCILTGHSLPPDALRL
jgi:hypothetical protein